jgi:hypothetical protein
MLNDIKRQLLHKEISLADAMRLAREEGKDVLTDIRKRWLDYELTGYPLVSGLISQAPFDVPEYRKVSGQYFARTPSGLWADVTDTQISEVAGFCAVPIGVIEDVTANPQNELVELSLGNILPETPVTMRIHRRQLDQIDESVRNRFIDLLSELETQE